MEKVVFFDRDGVINIEKEYLYKIEDFEFIEGVFETLLYLQNLGYKIVIITNQSGIGRGYYSLEQYQTLTVWLKEEFQKKGIDVSAIFYCPHEPTDDCRCRKPQIGMIEQTSQLFSIDYQNSWLVGDKDSDIQTALNANIPNTIQVCSGHSFERTHSLAKYVIDSVKEIPNIIKK